MTVYISVSLSVCFIQQKVDRKLTYLPEFVAKTESLSNLLPREFCIKSLTFFMGRDEEERLLCPVRSINILKQSMDNVSLRLMNLCLSIR